MANALKMFRERKMVGQKQETFSGRSNDVVPTGDVNEADDRVKLEYRDAKGRKMTPKEAFRYICWNFHGKRPSKNKQEKRLKKEKGLRKSQVADGTNTGLMKSLKVAQQTTQQAHMVLNFKKPES